jgi:hypothetical protein
MTRIVVRKLTGYLIKFFQVENSSAFDKAGKLLRADVIPGAQRATGNPGSCVREAYIGVAEI